MLKNKASIIIPVYNQWDSLNKVLLGLSQQNLQSFEVIIIDDGSTDGIALTDGYTLSLKYNLEIILYHQTNCGRAAARNMGIKLSHNNIIIFCDADRVPSPDFVKQHLQSHTDDNRVVVGNQFDLFYKNIGALFVPDIQWQVIQRFSRHPNYFSRICMIYNKDKCVAPNLQWMSLLIGNSSISKKRILEVGSFDEDFKAWGFEHFELGMRLQSHGIKFCRNMYASSYHIPHSRNDYFYKHMIDKSADLLAQKHPIINVEVMKMIIMNNVNVLDYNESIFKRD